MYRLLGKRGFSLIEVVVALGIISIVFAGTVTLIVQTANLNLLARDKTEAINFAQKVLNEKVVEIEGDCVLNYTPGTVSGPTYKKYSSFITIEESPNYNHGLDGTNFIQITVKVIWKSKGLPEDNSYELRQIVRK